MKKVLITGISSGIGEALALKYLSSGYFVYGLSKSKPNIEDRNLKFLYCNLSNLNIVKPYMLKFLNSVKNLEYVILNAGILGKIDKMRYISTETLSEVFNINLLSNKEIIDAILDLNIDVKQIVAISSKASVDTNEGLGAYSLSKAALNMLIQIYAKELNNIHLSSITPGLVDTKMVKILLDMDKDRYNFVDKFKQLDLQDRQKSADMLFEAFPKLTKYKSGSFVEIKDII